MSVINVLLIGSGGREHALAWKLAASPMLGELYAAPGNPGMAELAQCVDLDFADHQAVIAFCKEKSIGLVVIGPEAPLVAGIVDDLAGAGIKTFGPTRAAAQLEGSKGFTKELCSRHGIPTARYSLAGTKREALERLHEHALPVVIKADGLAAGKGVTVAFSRADAEAAIENLFERRNGCESGDRGVSRRRGGKLFRFGRWNPCGGARHRARPQTGPRSGHGAKHRRDGGLFTCPGDERGALPADDGGDHLANHQSNAGRRRTVQGSSLRGADDNAEGPKLIEYNVRFGDPECQVLMVRLKDDLLTLLIAAVEGELDHVSVRWNDTAALTVVMAANGYPGECGEGQRNQGPR